MGDLLDGVRSSSVVAEFVVHVLGDLGFVDGVIRALPAPPQPLRFQATISRGPAGTPLIVYPGCQGAGARRWCGVLAIAPDGTAPRRLVRATNGSRPVGTAALWGDRVAWAERRRGRTGVVLARRLGRGGRPVEQARYRAGRVLELALLGRRLAVNVWRGSDTVPDEQQLWIGGLGGRRLRLLSHMGTGISAWSFVGVAFSGRALTYAIVQHAADTLAPGSAVRYRDGRFEHAQAVPTDLSGYAGTSGPTSYWMTRSLTGGSRLQTTQLRYQPGPPKR